MVGAGIDTSMKALGFNQPLVNPVLVPLFPLFPSSA